MNNFIHHAPTFMLALILVLSSMPAGAQMVQIENLAKLTPGRTKAKNALWVENPLNLQFKSTNRIVVANIQGPAEITMMHFAYGRAQLGKDPKKPLSKQIGNGEPLSRDLVLQIYWDGETNPSVKCPLVDFYCDPNDSRAIIHNALLNVNRGFNEYFPMPFRKSAKVVLDYEGSVSPGADLQRMLPCYSYVCYRTLRKFLSNTGYFHASWRQESLLLGAREYVALDAKGKGKFVGWNMTIHSLYREGFPVDENEKFYVDGETNASTEFQGLEDSFGFSWGFPTNDTFFPLTGYFHFLNGAAAYRFFVPDAINFEKSLKFTIGFGDREKSWKKRFSKPDTKVQLSSTVYWYQDEPHAPLPPLPPVEKRSPVAMMNRWEPVIQAYEVADRTNPPPSDAILFTGASNIHMWKDVTDAFPGHKVFNRGFGGAEMSDLVEFAGRIVIPYRPKVVVIYAGDNDLANDKTPEQILTDFSAFVREVHAALPHTIIGCIAVKPSPSRAKLVPQVKKTDALLDEFCRTNDSAVYLDDLMPMLSPTGGPRPELFDKDGLHLNEKGRAIWASLIQPLLDKYDPPASRQPQ